MKVLPWILLLTALGIAITFLVANISKIAIEPVVQCVAAFICLMLVVGSLVSMATDGREDTDAKTK